MKITRKGISMDVPGKQPMVGEKAPDFSLVNIKKQIVHLSDLLGKPVLISVVPDIDTRVCSIQTKRFNQEAAKETDIHFVTISNNTREEQANWCAAEGVDMLMLHDPDSIFGQAYGLFVPETGRFVRSIFVLDAKGTIVYEELVEEQTNEPDYQKALEEAKALI
ncbi:AhpC/TSA family protein [Enterococcus phoeniculicola]|uniref:AhpC/TSA family protein n=1 Tax=Enterococcus phoeniculicola ATCC BAA-412 TaxID=1158610 RepID=R3WMQ8_9ENTE|nr:thiol peroxidase [Enterococcus phoeniculicola]EOL48752.1 AhpC/TSA family protein [Enterococcus phoeniculicola ATCC BAA-412]EOT72598.1 AhpC/TSA family protein [Enterococcus phoeniculicola ATCC BAA-412]OJG71872.1 AhpC/TSA family protein [Enterococcus phoeniculicola]